MNDVNYLILCSIRKGKNKKTKSFKHNLTKMALTNNFIGTINFVAVLLSIPIIDVRIRLTTEPGDSCVKVLLWPAIILGVLILVVALAGFVGAFWRIPTLLVLYLIAMLATSQFGFVEG